MFQRLRTQFELWVALGPLWFKLMKRMFFMYRSSWRLIVIKAKGAQKGYYK